MPQFEKLVEIFGPWLTLGIYILLKDVIPFVKNKYLPAKMKRAEEEHKARVDELAAERQAAQVERIARQEELTDERKWHRQMELERMEEMKRIGDAVEAIKQNLVQMNADNSAIRSAEDQIVDNQGLIMRKQDDHHNMTISTMHEHDNNMNKAVADMREEVARRRGIDEGIVKGKQLPKTGPTSAVGPEKPPEPHA